MHPDLAALSWPEQPPHAGAVALRALGEGDVAMVRDLATDPYVPLIGSLPGHADEAQARDWIHRQQQRLREGAGFTFAIADAASGAGLGSINLRCESAGQGRASVGYSVAPRSRGRGVAADALRALCGFAWTIGWLWRLEAYIEPANHASTRTACRAGFHREGLLRSYMMLGERRRDMLLYALLRP